MSTKATEMIECTPGVQGGYPCVAGTRTPVRTIVTHYYVTYPGDMDEVTRALPHLTREQIQAALDYYAQTPELVDEDIEGQRQALIDYFTRR